MEATPFDLTPAQKDLLASLSHETGKLVPALIAEALAGLVMTFSRALRNVHLSTVDMKGDRRAQKRDLTPRRSRLH